jgi:acetyl-CoA carboxylase carboxyltransferase component
LPCPSSGCHHRRADYGRLPVAHRSGLRGVPPKIALDNRLPYIQFVESAGGDLRRSTEDAEAEIRRQLTHFAESGRLFHDITCLSGARIPTVSVVFGSSTAGGAYQPGMSDYNIFIRNRSRVYLGGPPLVKMATGEDADDEALGGARCTRPPRAWPTTWPTTSRAPSVWLAT